METEIYYFSGTGNSLFVAKELQKRLQGASIIPMVSLLGQKTIPIKGKTVGFVFPVHALTIPIAVKRFIKKVQFDGCDYLFAVATRYGSSFQGFKVMDKLLRRKHKVLNAHFIINMGNNEARHESYIVPSKENILAMESTALKKLDHIKTIVESKENSRLKDTEANLPISSNKAINYLMEKLVVSGMALSEHIGGVQYFYTTSDCTGCGICEKVCLSQKINMQDKKPLWQRNVFCYMCFACLNYCPRVAVQIKDIPYVPSYTLKNGRYPHPYATVKDIAAQKKGEIEKQEVG